MDDLTQAKSGIKELSNKPDYGYASVISGAIEESVVDAAFVRSAIYELARMKLKQELSNKLPIIGFDGFIEHIKALEQAIAAVEAKADKRDARRLEAPTVWEGPRDANAVVIASEEVIDERAPPFTVHASPVSYSDVSTVKTGSRPSYEFVVRWIVAVLAVCGGSYVMFVMDPLSGVPQNAIRSQSVATAVYPNSAESLGTRSATADQIAVGRNEPIAMGHQAAPTANQYPFPLPTTFGVYAVSNGELHKLELLRMRLPDERIQVGPVLRQPAKIVLPSGDVSFVLFRGDLASQPVTEASVRVVAKIARSLKFKGDKAVHGKLEEAWAIRNVAHRFGVSPFGDRGDLFLLRPDAFGFVLPPGRYVLDLRGQAYEFTVAGAVSDPAHCLELVEAMNGSLYSPCK